MPIPLLRFPTVILAEIFQIMDLEEKFHISNCSCRSKNTIKHFSNSQKFQISLNFVEPFWFSVKSENSMEIMKKTFQGFWKFPEHSKIIDSWTRFENFARNLLEFLAEIFNLPTVTLEFKNRRFQFVTGFLEILNSLNLKIRHLEMSSKNSEDEIIKSILDYCRASEEIWISCPTTSRFEYSQKSTVPFNVSRIRISYSKWVSTWHLTNLFINCKRITLLECDSKNLNLSQFFKKWAESKSPLEFAELQCYDQNLTLAGIMKNVKSTVIQRVTVDGRLLNHPSYLIVQQKTGRQTIIYWHRFITLTMDFEL